MSEKHLLTPDDLGLEKRRTARNPIKLEVARAQMEKEAINRALYFADNNISEAARQLGVSRVTLYRLMNKPEPNQ
jgi:transcriptional regulator of acetoin/glycerol metabolism